MSLQFITDKEILAHVSKRPGETKIGECISFSKNHEEFNKLLNDNTFKYVLLGIPEDIGVLANYGRPGASEAWQFFLSKFLNIQSNKFFDGHQLFIAGEIFTNDLMQLKNNFLNDKSRLSKIVEELDNRVEAVIFKICEANKIPVIIGGGHNNAYPIIKAVSKSLKQKISVANIDPHADLRNTQARHSGNAFSFAYQEGYINKYIVFGLHEGYNNTHILEQFDNKTRKYITYENCLQSVVHIRYQANEINAFLQDENICFEFDCDSIAGFPASAETLSGFTPNEARSIIMTMAANTKIRSFHLSEFAPNINPQIAESAAKLLANMVADFIKINSNYHNQIQKELFDLN
jgi:formiminoglutamase